MINKLRALVLVGCMALAPAAFAIPFTINITGGASTGLTGNWNLTGPTTTGSSFSVSLFNPYSASRDIAAGAYTWSISSGWEGFGGASWSLFANNLLVGSGDTGGFRIAFKINETGQFVAVPEPGTLALLGLGLLGIGFSVRRRQTEV